MERDTYIFVVSIRELCGPELCFPEASDGDGGEWALAEIEDLTQEEAEAVAYATCKANECGIAQVWCVSATESRKNLGQHLVRCRQAAEVRDALRANTADPAGMLYLLASCALQHGERVRRERPGAMEAGESVQAGTFEVVDSEIGKKVIFDPRNAERWGPVPEYEGWIPGDDRPECFPKGTLYRHDKRAWTRIIEHTYREASLSCDPEARRMSDTEAVSWLIRHGFSVPSDMVHMADEILFQPGPPMPKPLLNEGDDTIRPRWDAERGELLFNGRSCKKYRQRATNQRMLLNAFEEEGWPPRIDDPLPGDGKVNPKERLRDTVRGVNTNCDGIRFELDGTGEGVIWSRVNQGKADDIPF